MNKKEIFCLSSAMVFAVLIIADLVLELFGISTFLLSKRVFTAFLGLFIIIAAVCFAVLIFSFIKDRKDNFSDGFNKAVKVITAVVTVILVCFGVFHYLFMNEATVYKSVADDKRHEVLIETDALTGGWNVTIYKRYSSFFKKENASFVIYDMVSEDEDVSVTWYDDGCDISYEYYSDYASTSEPEIFTQRVYFKSRAEVNM